jgi:hypothetical protein
MASHDEQHVNVVVVVSGVPRAERVPLGAPLSQLVKKVLNDSGDQGRPVGDFELRTEDGRELDLSMSGREAGLFDGQTLFLNPRAGAGG